MGKTRPCMSVVLRITTCARAGADCRPGGKPRMIRSTSEIVAQRSCFVRFIGRFQISRRTISLTPRFSESVGKSAVRHEMFIETGIALYLILMRVFAIYKHFAALRLFPDRLLQRGDQS